MLIRRSSTLNFSGLLCLSLFSSWKETDTYTLDGTNVSLKKVGVVWRMKLLFSSLDMSLKTEARGDVS